MYEARFYTNIDFIGRSDSASERLEIYWGNRQKYMYSNEWTHSRSLIDLYSIIHQFGVNSCLVKEKYQEFQDLTALKNFFRDNSEFSLVVSVSTQLLEDGISEIAKEIHNFSAPVIDFSSGESWRIIFDSLDDGWVFINADYWYLFRWYVID